MIKMSVLLMLIIFSTVYVGTVKKHNFYSDITPAEITTAISKANAPVKWQKVSPLSQHSDAKIIRDDCATGVYGFIAAIISLRIF